jgi:hypothetical protein
MAPSSEPLIPYGVTIRPEPMMLKDPVHFGRWWLKVLGSVEDYNQAAYVFVVDCEPCNEDGSTPCEDKRYRILIRQAVTRLSFQDFGLPKDPRIFETILKQAERRLEESPLCCIRHALMGKWDGSPCILGEGQSAKRTEEAG